MPVLVGEVLVGADSVYLETYDDGRLDRLSDRFTTLAGSNIPPAHPKTRVIRKDPRYSLALTWRWQIPEDLSAADRRRIEAEQFAYIIKEVWPNTAQPFLRWRTPLQAAKAGDSEISLRAAILVLETGNEQTSSAVVDWNGLRAQLGVSPEPTIDVDAADVGRIHLGRLSTIDVDRLDDDRLIALYKRARQWGVTVSAERAAHRIAGQPTLLAKAEIEPIALYGDLARHAAARHDRADAESWLARGREADPPAQRSAHALAWNMVGLELDMMLDPPDAWVPKLGGLLEKHCVDREATLAVFTRLAQLGLVHLRQDPNNPDQAILDTRFLESLLAQYGPRVVVAGAEPGSGAAAGQGQIWTPGSAAKPGAVWTPGAAANTGSGRQTAGIILPRP